MFRYSQSILTRVLDRWLWTCSTKCIYSQRHKGIIRVASHVCLLVLSYDRQMISTKSFWNQSLRISPAYSRLSPHQGFLGWLHTIRFPRKHQVCLCGKPTTQAGDASTNGKWGFSQVVSLTGFIAKLPPRFNDRWKDWLRLRLPGPKSGLSMFSFPVGCAPKLS